MSDKSGAPPCGIYIRINDYSNMERLVTNIRQIAMVINRASGYEKNMNVLEIAVENDDPQTLAHAEGLITLARAEGMVAITTGLWGAMKKLEPDGILAGSVREYKLARELFGEEAIIGLACDQSQKSAKKALELGADYVALKGDVNLVHWWVDLSEKPCMVSGNITNDNCGVFARAGASFVDVTDYIFNHEKGIMQGTVNILYALDLAATNTTLN